MLPKPKSFVQVKKKKKLNTCSNSRRSHKAVPSGHTLTGVGGEPYQTPC